MQIYDLLCGCKSFSTAYDELELDTLGDKRQHYGFNSVMKFHLYGTSASGIEVSEYATTDENGVATFKNVLIAGAAGYTMEEVDTAVRYVISDGNMEYKSLLAMVTEINATQVDTQDKRRLIIVYKSI